MKRLLWVMTICIVLFVLWMNATPGHFQRDCVGVGYHPNEYRCAILPAPRNGRFDALLLAISAVDFNR